MTISRTDPKRLLAALGRALAAPALFITVCSHAAELIDAATMHTDGHAFFISANGVWLVDSVPPLYLRVLDCNEARLKALEELSALDQELGGMGYVKE